MTRAKRCGWLAGVFALVAAMPAMGQESALAQVPAKAAIVIHVRGFEMTKNRLVAMVKNAVPDFGGIIQAKLDEAIEHGLGERKIKGVPPDGPIFVVITELPKPGEHPKNVAVILKVNAYAAFRDGILTADEKKGLKKEGGYEVTKLGTSGEDIYFVDRKGFAIATPTKEVAEQFVKGQPGVGGQWGRDLSDRFLKSDVAIFVDTNAILQQYGEQIAEGRQMIENLLAASGDAATAEMAKKGIEMLFQVLKDSRGGLLTASFHPEGLALHMGARFGAESKSNNILKSAKSSTFPELGKLPAGQMVYSAQLNSAEMMKALAPLIAAMQAGGDEKSAQILKEVQEDLAAAGPGLALQAVQMVEGLDIQHFANPEKAVQAQLKLFNAIKAGGQFQGMAIKKADLKEKAETFRGFTLHRAELTFDFEKALEGVPVGGKEIIETMKKFMGEGITTWFGTDGKVLVQVRAKDWKTAQGQLDQFFASKSSVGERKEFQEARKHLPDEAAVVSLIHMPTFLHFMGEMAMAGMQAALGGMVPAIGPLPKPSLTEGDFMGAAVTLKSEYGSIDIWVPGSVAREVKKLAEPFLKIFNPGGGE